MPLSVSKDEVSRVLTRLEPAPEPEPRVVTALDRIGAAFSLDNTVVSTLNRLREEPLPEGDPDLFDPLEHLRPGEGPIAGRFAEADSRAEMNRIRKRIQREREARAILGESPVAGFLATALAVAGDPTSYIPVIGQRRAGLTIAQRAARLGLGTAAEVTLAEGVLQATQQERPVSETVASVILGGAFGAAVGAGAGARAAARERAVRDFSILIDQMAADTGDAVAPGASRTPEAAGAEAFRPVGDPEDTRLGGGLEGTLRNFAKLRGVAAPSVELMSSPLARSREAALRLVGGGGLITRGMMRGFSHGPDAETRIKSYNRILGEAVKVEKQAFREYRRQGGTLSRDQFRQEIGKAMRRGDDSLIPEVARVAQTFRAQVIEPLTNDAQALGLLPEDLDPKTALSYFTRVYDREAIKANRPEFERRVEAYLRRVVDREELAADAEYGEMAAAVADSVLGHPGGRVPFLKVPRVRGPLKERTFLIPDEEIEDFLESNAMEVLARFVRTMAGDIEMKRAFGRSDPGEELAKGIVDEAAEAARRIKDPKARRAIQNRAEREGELVQDLVDLLRGTNRRPADPRFDGLFRILRSARNLNFVRLLGKVVISQIPDFGKLVFENGTARVFGPLLADMGRNFQGVRMAKKEAQLGGTAWDLALATRARSQLDLGDRLVNETAFERRLDELAQGFGTVVGLNPYNVFAKSATSMVAGTQMLKTIEKAARVGIEGLSKAEKLRVGRSPLRPDDLERIARQSDKWQRLGNPDGFGEVVIANTEAWDDAAAVRAFRDHLLRDVDNTVITPGRGDAPVWTTAEWGKTIFQFKRFASASNQRILASGLQRRDMQAAQGVAFMVGIGALGVALRDLAIDGQVRERTPQEWAVDAVDRSGAASLFVEMDAIAGSVSGGELSLQRLASGQEASRFRARTPLETVGGPTVGLVNDLRNAVQGTLKGDLTQSDLHKVRRLVPGNNALGVSFLFDALERGAGEAFGLPERQSRGGSRTLALPTER